MPAVITGLGVVSALGRGAGALWSALSAGQDGLREIRRLSPDEVGVAIAGMVPDKNDAAHRATPGWQLCLEFAADAAREAWRAAGLDVERPPPARIALVMGSSLGDRMRLHRMTESLGDLLEIAGPRLTVSTACASSTNALGLGLDLLRMGAADVVLAGGTDVLTPLVLAGFQSLGVLAQGKCAPFSAPAGTTLGEGAGFLVLERAGARRRPSSPLLLGYGLSADGYHDTSPDPTGGGVARAMRAALAHAGVAPERVDYVNAHGTGTAANDPAEWRAIEAVLGARAHEVPVSASKSFLGHAQGAAGVVETIATLVAMSHGAVPPTMRYQGPRPHSPSDAVGQDTPRPARCRVAVCTSSAFGGANCAVVVAADAQDAGDGAAAAAPRERRVYVVGLGAVGPHGDTLEALADALTTPRAAGPARVPPGCLERALPSCDPRGLDPSTRHLTAAAAGALAEGGIRVRGTDRERTGMFVAIDRVSRASENELDRTIEESGLRRMSAAMFARMVLNAPAGTCSRLLGLRGPASTVSAARAGGLFAIVYAAEHLASCDDADILLAGAVDEVDDAEAARGLGEGAACAVLSRSPSGAGVRVAGWAIAGPGALADAVGGAATRAGIGADAADALFGPAPAGLAVPRVTDQGHTAWGEATSSALAFVAATLWLRRRGAGVAIVCADGGGTATCAVVLVAEGRQLA